ncbi:MAG: CBASS cGAMP-activated phospholipase [Vicingaceae bacterium]
MRKVRILSIDGGGIRGVLAGEVLKRLEDKLQAKSQDPNLKLADYFDFMAGTSTGGILSLCYLCPNEDGQPKYSAHDALNFYMEKGSSIFDRNTWQRIKSGDGVTDEKYSAKALEKALKETFGDTKLSELLKPCIISSYDIANGKPHFFKQARANNDIYDFKVRDVARSTSAAPTYFEAALVENGIGTDYALVDGGVFINNPALAAYSEVRNMHFEGIEKEAPTAEDMMIVSVSTGSKAKKYNYEKAKDWGMIQWIKPVLEIMMSGNSQTVDYHLKRIYDTLTDDHKRDYHRLDPQVLTANAEMDDASKENLLKLKEDGLSYVSQTAVDTELDDIVEKLIDFGPKT